MPWPWSQPNPTRYSITSDELRNRLNSLNCDEGIQLKDNTYWYYGLDDWIRVLSATRRNMPSYVRDQFDCDKFAFVTCTRSILDSKLNTCGYVEGNSSKFYDPVTKSDRHAWNIVVIANPEGTISLRYYEPQDGTFWLTDSPSTYIPHLIIFP
jgi:hypothetical protein